MNLDSSTSPNIEFNKAEVDQLVADLNTDKG